MTVNATDDHSLVGVPVVRRAQGHRAREDGEEAVAADELGSAVRRQQRGQRQHRFAVLGQAQRLGARAEGLSAQQPAGDDPGPGAEHDLAHDVPPDPRRSLADAEPAGQQQEGQVDEGEGQAVVEPGLRGQRESDVVVLLGAVVLLGGRVRVVEVLGERLADLDVGGQDGIGRREDRPQQERDGGRQPGDPPADDRDAEDGERHRHGQQPPHRRPRVPRPPGPEVEGAVDGESDAHQRDEHGELGEVHDQRAVVLRLEAHLVGERQQADEHSQSDQHHRRRQRHPPGGLRQHHRDQQRQTEQEVDRGARHGVTAPACRRTTPGSRRSPARRPSPGRRW